MHRRLIVLTALCGCVTVTMRQPLKIDYTPATGTELPAVPPEQVTLYEYRPEVLDAWPDGIAIHIGPVANPNQRLELAPDYPTADSPHRLVGALTIKPGDRIPREAVRKELIAFAAGRGANALFLISEDYRLVEALAVRVSTAEAARNYPSAAQGITSAAESLGTDFTPEGSPVNGALEAFQPLSISARRGRCYAVAFALDPAADLSKHARKGMAWKLKSPDGDIRATVPYIGQAPNELVTLRSHASRVGCPQMDGPLEMDLQATFGSARRDAPIHDLGKGPLVLQVFSKAVSEEQLRKRAETSQRLQQDATQRTQARAKEQCAQCQHLLLGCTEQRVQDCPGYAKCLTRKSIRVEECQ